MDKVYNVLVYYYGSDEPKEVYDVTGYKKSIDIVEFTTTTGMIILNMNNVRQITFTEVK